VFPPRRVPLGGGRTLLIRPVAASDVAGLAELYARLDPEDRHRRFFSAFRPPRSFFEQIATAADRGGYGLVATVSGDGSADEVVGEAGYALLPNGDGELAITVADAWRGWLGPYLLDALIAAAAARGVPNLEADVLAVNGPMLAMAQARGSVTMSHPDWSVVRVVFGTAGTTPTWPRRHNRPRVLVEGAGGRWHGEEAVRAAGFDVLTCAGPTGRRRPCPALSGAPCPLAARADAVVISRPPEHSDWHALVDAHPHLHPGVPVCVETAGDVDAVGLVERLIDVGRLAAAPPR
jgi:RimJ/RimL family protein N-acetyltransferase